jgi:hypothetical protein
MVRILPDKSQTVCPVVLLCLLRRGSIMVFLRGPCSVRCSLSSTLETYRQAIVESFGLTAHGFADDSQLYFFCRLEQA